MGSGSGSFFIRIRRGRRSRWRWSGARRRGRGLFGLADVPPFASLGTRAFASPFLKMEAARPALCGKVLNRAASTHGGRHLLRGSRARDHSGFACVVEEAAGVNHRANFAEGGERVRAPVYG